METFLVTAFKFVVGSGVCASLILFIGGAVKTVIFNSGADCLAAGLQLAGGLLGLFKYGVV